MKTLVILPPVLTTLHLELLSAARSLGEVEVVSLGEPDTATLARFGVGSAYVPSIEGHPWDSAGVAEAVATVIRAASPDAVLVVSSFAGKAIAARLAVVFDGGAVVDVTSLRLENGRVIAGKTVFGGSWDTECTVTRGLAVYAIKPTAFEILERPGGPVEVTHIEVAYTAHVNSVVRTRREAHPVSGRPGLEEAHIVVVGGRGVEGDFTLVESFADELGGTVGATRVATDEGWIDHSTQIGQTGATIAPRLYVGAGVSGAVHHTSGIQSAELIVAINTDSEAPIFEIADFGVVGDLNEVLPQAIEALRAAKQ